MYRRLGSVRRYSLAYIEIDWFVKVYQASGDGSIQQDRGGLVSHPEGIAEDFQGLWGDCFLVQPEEPAGAGSKQEGFHDGRSNQVTKRVAREDLGKAIVAEWEDKGVDHGDQWVQEGGADKGGDRIDEARVGGDGSEEGDSELRDPS